VLVCTTLLTIAHVAVIYYASRHPLRTCIADHLYAFARDGRHRVTHLNAAIRTPADCPKDVDLVVLHTTFLAVRWNLGRFDRMVDRWLPVSRLSAPVIALPQDEFINTDGLERCLEAYGVPHVCSVAAAGQWRTIYPRLSASGVGFSRVLTGYLDRTTIDRSDRLAAERANRPRRIDVGYRAWRAEPWLGRHGRQKVEIAERFLSSIPEDLVADISLDDADTLLEDEWLRFMLDCRWTIGVEGGASIIDRDGAIRQRTLAWQASHPHAGFEEIEAACFPGREGSLDLRAISPRHLEACMTGIGQVLVEGDYNGLLEPERHYLPVRADYSNLPEVLDRLQDESARVEMVARARAEVVDAGPCSSRALVEAVLRAGGLDPDGDVPRAAPNPDIADQRSWGVVRRRQRIESAVRRIGGPILGARRRLLAATAGLRR
jgi:hypothetical protein